MQQQNPATTQNQQDGVDLPQRPLADAEGSTPGAPT